MKNQQSVPSSSHAAMAISQTTDHDKSSSLTDNSFKGPKYTENHWLC
ncbi:unnamed protein product [Cuscuta europaea]|nr:unnamed protein product [Cuscuta europaea]